MELLPSVVNTLEVVSTGQDWNAESSIKAATLLTSITQFEFIMALVVAHACFGFVKGLTVSSQGRSQDICSAYVEVVSVKTALYEVREDIDTFHKKLYATAVGLPETINASLPSIPRRWARQTFRSNVSALTPEDYYGKDLTVPFLDSNDGTY